MKIKKIIGENGPQSMLCANGNCPAVIVTDSDDIIIQGYELNDSECSSLTKPDNESFIKMPKEVLKKLAAQI